MFLAQPVPWAQSVWRLHDLGCLITPQGNDGDTAVKLRDAARAEILKYCAEPDLVG